MEFIFFKKKLDENLLNIYNTKALSGKIVYGFSRIEDGTVFVNATVIGLFSTLIGKIIHESLHIVAKLNGSEANEKVIEKIVKWCFE